MEKMMKVTEKVALGKVIELFGDQLDKEILDKLQMMYDKRAKSKSRAKSEKDLAKEKAREDERELIVEILREVGKPMSIAEIKAKSEVFEEYSSSKMSYLLRGLYDARMTDEVRVKRSVVKKVAHFEVC